MSQRLYNAPLHLSLASLAAILAACSLSPESEETPRVRQQMAAFTVQASPIGTEAPTPIKYNTGAYMSVASSGAEHLLVFHDGGRIRGLRYDQSGTVIDLDPWIQLGRNDDVSGSQAYTDLAYGGGAYMMVYMDGSDEAPGLYVQGIDPNGAVLGAPALVAPDGIYGAVVFNGTDFTVAFYDGDIGLVRVGLDGSILEDTKTQVTTSGVTNRPVLAMAEDVGLVVFEQDLNDTGRKVYAARFTPEGEVLDPGGLLISDSTTGSWDVSVAAGTSEFLAIWGGPAGAIYGSIVGFDGALPRSEFPLSRTGLSFGGSAVAYDGTQYLVAWEDEGSDEYSIHGALLTAAGDFVDTGDVVLARGTRAYQSWEMDLQWTGDHYALVYGADGIDGRLLDAELNELSPGLLELSVLPNSQYLSSVAYDGEAYVVGYSDELDDDTNDQVKSVRIDGSGTLLADEATPISTNSGGELAWSVSVASNGQNTMYAYTVHGEVQETFVRVGEGGGELSEPVALGMLEGSDLQIASNGDGYLGIFDAGENANGNPAEIWGQVFDAAGSVSGNTFLIKEMGRPRAGIFASGDGYVLVYSGQEVGGEEITGSTVYLNGAGEEETDFGPVAEGNHYLRAASNGEQTLAVWEDDERQNVWARLLDHESGWAEPLVLASDLDTGGTAVAWDGEQFVVVWSHSRLAMWSRNVMTDGGLTASEEILSGDYVSPALTPGKEGQMLLSYVRYGDGLQYRRVESRIVGDVDAPVVPDEGEDPDTETDGSGGAVGSGGTAGNDGTEPSETSGSGGSEAGEGTDGEATANSGSDGQQATDASAGAGDPVAGVGPSNNTAGSSDEGGACSIAAPGRSGAGWPWMGLFLMGAAFRSRRRVR